MSDQGGYIKLYRKTLHSSVWKNWQLWRLFEWCLLEAAYKPVTVYVGKSAVDLQPGQLLFGRRMAHIGTGLSEQTVRTCLHVLTIGNNPMLTIRSTKAYSIATIVNWDKYQNEKDDANQQSTTSPTNSQPTSNQQPTKPGDGFDGKISPISPCARTPAKQVVEEVKEVKKHTYTGGIENVEASMSESYRFVLDVFREATGRKQDPAAKAGARELALAIDAGELERDSVRHVIEAGMNDPALKNQTLRGVARNFGNYLPKKARRDTSDARTGWALRQQEEALGITHGDD